MPEFVSEKHRQLHEMINEYNPELELKFVPAEARECDETFPFEIVHTPPNNPPYTVRRVRVEGMNEQLIIWLYESEQRTPGLEGFLEREERAKKAWLDKQAKDAMDEKLDVAKHIIGGKNFYRHDGKVYS